MENNAKSLLIYQKHVCVVGIYNTTERTTPPDTPPPSPLFAPLFAPIVCNTVHQLFCLVGLCVCVNNVKLRGWGVFVFCFCICVCLYVRVYNMCVSKYYYYVCGFFSFFVLNFSLSL